MAAYEYGTTEGGLTKMIVGKSGRWFAILAERTPATRTVVSCGHTDHRTRRDAESCLDRLRP